MPGPTAKVTPEKKQPPPVKIRAKVPPSYGAGYLSPTALPYPAPFAYGADYLGEEAPPYPEEGKVPPLKTASFLEDLLGQGHYQGGKGVGKPSTKREEAFIYDFMKRTGRAPTEGEIPHGWDVREDVYLPGSTMGKMGFQNWDEYYAAFQAGEPFGPWGGEEVPEGGTVVTKEGKPYLRYMEDVPQGYYDQGRVIPRLEPGMPVPERMRAEAMGAGEVYPQYDRGPFQRPSMEDALGSYSPEVVQLSRLKDYLTAQIDKDEPGIQAILDRVEQVKADREQQVAQGLMDKTQADSDISFALQAAMMDIETEGLMTEDKAEQIASEAMEAFEKGTKSTDLPFFTESMGAEGESLMNLYNQFLGGAEQRYKEEQAKIPEWTGYREEKEPVAPYTDNMAYRDFQTYAEGLDYAPEWEQWLKSQFQEYFQKWRRQGEEIGFIQFVNNELVRGG